MSRLDYFDEGAHSSKPSLLICDPMVGMGTETTQVNLATAVGRHFITRYYQKGSVMEKYRSFPMAHWYRCRLEGHCSYLLSDFPFEASF